VSDNGELEPGMDLGGVSKEFIELLIKEIFRVEYGLFTKNDNGSNIGHLYHYCVYGIELY
jgi:hypothetical protein